MSNSVNARSCENNGGRTYPPFLSNSIKSLTEDPRSMEGMIGEHLDNALDAGATKFKITTERGDAGVVSRVILCDDGSGMDYEELDLSFHLGRPGDWGPRPGKLGRFGVGGTMSAMQKANRKTTVTWNGVPRAVIGRFYDMDVIEEIGQYVTDELSADFAAQIWEEFSLNSANPGTVILINNFKKTEREKDAIARIKRWVGKTYTKDLDSGRISVEINGDIINPSCPVGTDLLGRGAVINKFPILYSGEKIAEGTAVDLLKVPGYTGKSRTQSLTDMEGVAFERNGRVIMTAQMGNELGGGLQKRHPRFRFFRGLVQFTDAADKIFGINKDKDKLDLDQSIRDLLAETFKPHIKASGLNHDNWSKSKTEEKNPIILDGIVQEAQGKHGLAPKKKRPPVQNVKKPVNSGDNKVLNHPTRATAPWLEAVAEENLGKLASPWRFDSKSKIILLNVDNKYVRENYVGRTVDQKEMVIRLAVAITSAQIELEEHHDEEVLSQVLDILYKKLRAGA